MIFTSAVVSVAIATSLVQAAPAAVEERGFGVDGPFGPGGIFGPCGKFGSRKCHKTTATATATATSAAEPAVETSIEDGDFDKRSYGPNGPYGPHGAYGVDGPFGPGGSFGPCGEFGGPDCPTTTAAAAPPAKTEAANIAPPAAAPLATAPMSHAPGANPTVLYWKDYKITGDDCENLYNCIYPKNGRWPFLNDATCPVLIDVYHPRPECFETDKKADADFQGCAKSNKVDLNKYKQ